VLALGFVLFKRSVTRRQLVALASATAACCWCSATRSRSPARNVALGAALVFGSAVSYAVYLVYSGEEVKRLGALRLTGLATTVACLLCIAQFFVLRPVSAMAVAPEVIWLSVLNATLCTFAPVLMVMMAIERIGATLAAQGPA
jgi:drug/metabolite transporter (DMT)-like permease